MHLSRNPISFFDALIEKAINGDDKAFKKIYDAISAKMYNLCLRYAGNESDADDFFQEGIMRLYSNLKNFRKEGSFEGWARKIFVRVCLDYLKKNKIFISAINEATPVAELSFNGYDKLSGEDLMKVIRKMPDGYRTVVHLLLVEGYNHKEVSEMLNISEESSRSQLRRARASLQKVINEL